jgi:hypothetical protein
VMWIFFFLGHPTLFVLRHRLDSPGKRKQVIRVVGPASSGSEKVIAAMKGMNGSFLSKRGLVVEHQVIFVPLRQRR